MKRFRVWVILAVIASSFPFQGCSLYRHVEKDLLPKHDQVLMFDLSYDLVYLRTLEAMENVSGWELEETEKEKGIIRVRNTDYSRFGDKDLQFATLEIRRIAREQTSVQLSKDTQYIVGGDKLLSAITEFVGREL